LAFTRLKLDSACRLAMIILDNAVECSFRAYILNEKRLVGKYKPITPSQWANDKESFAAVMNHAYNHSKSTSLPDKNDVMNYHDTRNELYHRAKPITVTTGVIRKYFGFEKTILKELFGFSTTDDAWNEQAASVRNAFQEKPKQILVPIEFRKEGNNALVDGVQALDQKEAIPIVIHCFSTLFARNPTTEELVDSMTASGVPIGRGTLAVQLVSLRRSKSVKKGRYEVSNTYRKKINRTYQLKRAN
jgi:hypothetical protein